MCIYVSSKHAGSVEQNKNIADPKEETMQAGQPSITAMRAARSRAKHQLFDTPLIFEDQLSLRILGSAEEDSLRSERSSDGLLARAFRAGLVARSRIAEDELHEAVKRGVRQYVVLGAGLDTFAYRNPYPRAALQVFEVDHPATQAWKKKRLAEASIAVPGDLRFVGIDFETQSLGERLRQAGYDFSAPGQFSCLGVTMYLGRSAVMETLQFVAAGTPGSGIVFDYVPGYSSRGPLGKLFLRMLAYRFARLGEPWKGLFEPEMLAAEMTAMGFSQVSDISAEELNSRFFKDRRDHLKFNAFGMKLARLGHVMVAHK
jgi:methyltransferase (TIGR00027 family)